jgi:hypothetical protein
MAVEVLVDSSFVCSLGEGESTQALEAILVSANDAPLPKVQ